MTRRLCKVLLAVSVLDNPCPLFDSRWCPLVINHHGSRSSLVWQSIVEHNIQEGLVNMDSAIIADVAELAEIVHKLADSGASGANHLGKLLLGHGRNHGLRFSGLTKLSHDQQCAGKTLLAVVEQLIDQVFPSPNPAKQNELQEDVRKLMLLMEEQSHVLAA